MEAKKIAETKGSNQLTDAHFIYLQDLVYKKMGIRLTPVKKMMVQNRLGRFVRQSGIDSLSVLLHAVRADENGPVAQSVYDAISTNHTFFFRELNHFKYLSLSLLPSIVEKCVNEKRPLKIWSAACSSGEEAITLAITIEEFKRVHSVKNLHFDILATDISKTVLQIAAKGIYPAEAVSGFSYDIKKNYFQQGIGSYNSMVRVKKELSSHIRFAKHNLLDPLPRQESFDIVFCRNVMIYFDTESKRRLLENLKRMMKPESYLFIGHSESLYNTIPDFELVQPTVYRNVT